MNRKTVSAAVTTFAAVLALASVAHADGLALEPARLETGARASLQKDIDAFRVARPDVVARVRDVAGVKPEVYSKSQRPTPEATRELRLLGADALLPMLDALAFDASQPGLSAAEHEALVVGMLTVVGELRDARSAPVLAAIFAKQSGSEPVALAAADALGKLCGASEIAQLSKRAEEKGAIRLAALQGLGECRKLEAATILIKRLRAATDDDTKLAAVRGLGSLGSSWAWVAKGAAEQARGDAIREKISDALLETIAGAGAGKQAATVRSEARRAALKCDHASAPERARQAAASADKRGDQAAAKVFRAIEQRLAKRSRR